MGRRGSFEDWPSPLVSCPSPSSSSSALSSCSLFFCCHLLLLLSSFMLRGLGSSFSIWSAQRSTLRGRTDWNCCCSLWCVGGVGGMTWEVSHSFTLSFPVSTSFFPPNFHLNDFVSLYIFVPSLQLILPQSKSDSGLMPSWFPHTRNLPAWQQTN